MRTLQQIAITIIYIQSIGLGLIAITWIYSKVFEKVIDTLKLHEIFREYLIERVFKYGGGFRRKKLVATVCTRAANHDGPCNGFPSKTCKVYQQPEEKISHVTYDGRTIVDMNKLMRDPEVKQTLDRMDSSVKPVRK